MQEVFEGILEVTLDSLLHAVSKFTNHRFPKETMTRTRMIATVILAMIVTLMFVGLVIAVLSLVELQFPRLFDFIRFD